MNKGVAFPFFVSTLRGHFLLPKYHKDSVITIYPETGWKQNFSDFVIVDIFCGYRILMNDPKNLSYDLDLVDSGIKYGARLKFNLKKIWQWAREKG